jgi:DNA-binding protein H-NS
MATKKPEQTLAALHAQIAKLQAQAEAVRKQEIGEVISKIKEAVAHYGLTAADLGLERARGKPVRPRTGAATTSKAQSAKGATKKQQSRVVKYRDDKGNTWVGMGKRPAWFTAALAAGKTLEDLKA